MRHTSLLVFAIAMLAIPAVGSPINYTFTGQGGLAGGFILDDEANWDISTQPGVVTIGTVSSPLHVLWGTFGTYAFVGTPRLVVAEYFIDTFEDYWIVRSPITFSTGGSPAITNLNLFVYGYLSGFSFTPPSVNPNQYNFQYTVAFSNGSFVAVPLQSLQKVPEPPSFAIWFLAFGFIAAARFFTGSKATCGDSAAP